MVYTEIKEKNGKKYYYRVKSVREGKKVSKERIYLGMNLGKKDLERKEIKANAELDILSNLLNKEESEFLDKLKEKYQSEPKSTEENRYESFCAQFTFNSTAIEGNTLTLQETAQLLFDKIVPATKSLREINETLNHKKAFDYILEYKERITKDFILELHKLVTKDTLRAELEKEVGKYRTVQNYIPAAEWIPPKPDEVPQEMQTLLSWYSKNERKLHPLILASYFHIGFETIHPFVDGNGRVGRLLMNFILHRHEYPMINIPNAIKHRYYAALHDAQVKGNLRSFIELMINILKDIKIMI